MNNIKLDNNRLSWNNFEKNLRTSFQEIRDDNDLFDVTLVCDDEQIQAHKLILSAASDFFRNIFKRNPHQHPLIYLKGVKHFEMVSIQYVGLLAQKIIQLLSKFIVM